MGLTIFHITLLDIPALILNVKNIIVYYVEYYQSHGTLLWIWKMLCGWMKWNWFRNPRKYHFPLLPRNSQPIDDSNKFTHEGNVKWLPSFLPHEVTLRITYLHTLGHAGRKDSMSLGSEIFNLGEVNFLRYCTEWVHSHMMWALHTF